jgi:hypothetical protein
MLIQDYKHGDEEAILDLFELVFKKPMSLEFWNWRFKNNPVNKFMIKLMWDDKKLAGHYAVSPVMLQLNNEVKLTGLSMTTMTHPEYTGQGLFQQLAESLYHDINIKDNAVAVWGFPNNNSHRGFIKNLSWKDITVLPMISCDVKKLKPKETPNIKRIYSFTQVHEKAYNDFFSEYAIKVRKSIEYLNWRYTNNPLNDYYILEIDEGKNGFVVCKEFKVSGANGKNQIDIVDWCLPKNESLTQNVIQHLAFTFSHEKYLQYNIWMPLQDERYLYFEKLGFVHSSPITYWGLREFSNNAGIDEKHWWIQLGDSDVY